MKSNEVSALPTVYDLAAIIAIQQCVSPARITPSTRLVEDLGLDSLEMQSVLLTLEEEHNIRLPPGSLAGVATVDDLAAAIKRAVYSAMADV
jgi:acyl carrier protein